MKNFPFLAQALGDAHRTSGQNAVAMGPSLAKILDHNDLASKKDFDPLLRELLVTLRRVNERGQRTVREPQLRREVSVRSTGATTSRLDACQRPSGERMQQIDH